MLGILAHAIADAASLLRVAATLLHERRVAPQGRGLFRNPRIVFRGDLTRPPGERPGPDGLPPRAG